MEKRCPYEEVYGLLQQIEEHILYLKKSDGTWDGNSDEQSAVNNICAEAVLLSLGKPPSYGFQQRLDTLLDIMRGASNHNRDYLLPYAIGLYVKSNVEKSSKGVREQFAQLLASVDSETNRIEFAIEYLVSIAYAFDLLGKDVCDSDLSDIEDGCRRICIDLIKQFGSILSVECKVKLLYCLAAFRLNDELVHLFTNHRSEIEGIRKKVRDDTILCLLLRPYMVLDVYCNRTIVLNLKNSLQCSQFDIQFKNIQENVARLIQYPEGSSGKTSRIEKKEDGDFEIIIPITNQQLQGLQTQAPSIAYLSSIALSLHNAGFSSVYTVPKPEIETYLSYKLSEHTETGRWVDKKNFVLSLEEITDVIYERKIIGASALVSVTGIGAAAGLLLTQQPTALAVSIPAILIILLQFISIIPNMAEHSLSLADLIIHKKRYKHNIYCEWESKMEGKNVHK